MSKLQKVLQVLEEQDLLVSVAASSTAGRGLG